MKKFLGRQVRNVETSETVEPCTPQRLKILQFTQALESACQIKAHDFVDTLAGADGDVLEHLIKILVKNLIE